MSEQFIICPFCGHVHQDTCDYPWRTGYSDEWKDEGEKVFDCDKCQREFLVILLVTHSFECYPKKEDQ